MEDKEKAGAVKRKVVQLQHSNGSKHYLLTYMPGAPGFDHDLYEVLNHLRPDVIVLDMSESKYESVKETGLTVDVPPLTWKQALDPYQYFKTAFMAPCLLENPTKELEILEKYIEEMGAQLVLAEKTNHTQWTRILTHQLDPRGGKEPLTPDEIVGMKVHVNKALEMHKKAT